MRVMPSADRLSELRDWIFPLVVSTIICIAALYSWASTDRDAYEHCRLISPAEARLICYDDAAAKAPAKGGTAPSLHTQQSNTGS